MGTLASELGPHAGGVAGQPRIYVDANVPAGLVAYMRTKLRWDTLFVIEHDDLRRAHDGEHFRLARQLGRTLITLDRDYLDDRKFPLEESGGVLVLTAPTEGGLIGLLKRFDAEIFRAVGSSLSAEPGVNPPAASPLPLKGRKLHVHVDWPGGDIIRQ